MNMVHMLKSGVTISFQSSCRCDSFHSVPGSVWAVAEPINHKPINPRSDGDNGASRGIERNKERRRKRRDTEEAESKCKLGLLPGIGKPSAFCW